MMKGCGVFIRDRQVGPKLATLLLMSMAGLTAGCATVDRVEETMVASQQAKLEGTSWRLVHFQSSDDAIGTIIPPNVERYTMKFMTGGSLVLGLDCNRGTGTWAVSQATQTGGSITFGPGAMTRAMCGPEAIDSRLARDLAHVRSFTFDGNRLVLALQADAGFYVWEAWNGN